MKKLYIMLLAMLLCVVSVHAQSEDDGTSTGNDQVVEYTTLANSGGFGNEGAANLFDGNSSTKWCSSFTNKQEGETVNGAFVVFKTSRPMTPTHYTLTTANDTQQSPGRNWKQWQLYGMNADSDEEVTRESENWVPLDKKYNIGPDQLPAANYTPVEFSLSEGNTTAYMYFKIELDEIISGSTMQMADFLLSDNTFISFTDANVKAICVSNWDTDGDGELSMEEVAAASSLGEVFKHNHNITTFKELRFFTGLSDIDAHAFNGCSSLTSITLPKSVTSIGTHAFDGCSSLTSITIPKNVTSIGDYAFNDCSSMTSITIPNSVTSIGEDAFNGCSELTSVEVENPTPLAITQNTFSNRTNAILIVRSGSKATYLAADYWNEFKEIIAMDDAISFADANVKAICVSNWDTNGDGELSYAEAEAVTSLSFCYNKSITSFNELKYFKGLSTIGREAFHGCTSLSSITIPNTVTTIEEKAFYQCSSLNSVVLGEQLKTIGKEAFYRCIGLTSITFPNSTTTIYAYAFDGCSNITSIIFGNQLTTIGEFAFYKCFNLSSITITNPNSMMTISASAFYECTNLHDVKIVVMDYSEFCNNNIAGVFKSPIHLIDSDKNEIIEYIIPEGVTTIGENAFKNCKGLTYVTIPSSVTSISQSAFYGCSGLSSITIPNGVTSIGQAAFLGCTGLTSVAIPNSVTNIGSSAFSGCKGLTSVKIGNGVSSIENGTFSSCENLSTVKIGKNISSIGYEAFNGCTSLTSITLPNMLASIGIRAFSSCDLISITIPDNVTKIGEEAFKDNSSLTTVILGDGITEIERQTFGGCTSLSSIIIPDEVKGIGDRAFANCAALTSITIPNSVESIGSEAFASNCNLATVIMGDGITEIKDRTFQNCIVLSSIIIPDRVTSIGESAFSNCPLTSVKLSESLTSVGGNAFSGCPLKSIELPDAFTIIPENLFRSNSFQYIKLGNNVKSIGKNAFGSSSEPLLEIGTSTPPAIDSNAFPNIAYLSDLNVIVPDAAAETAYRKAAVWQEMTFSNQNNISEVTVETPGDLSFELITQCNMMPAKVVGLKVNGTINADDFNQMLVNMKSLLRLDLSGCNITAIPDNALKGKTQLLELTLPIGLQTIGKSAFQDCTGLTSVIWGEQLTTIGESAFQGCTYLTGELNLPTTLTTIGKSAFVGTSYTSVKMPSTLKTIGDYAFNNVPIKQKLVLSKKVTSVGAYAFAGTKIQGLEIPDGMTIIGDYAFDGTPIQGHVTIPDGVTYLGKGAFRNSQLSTVFLPNSVTELSQGLFQNCPNLDLVYVPDNYTGLSGSAFDGCGALTILRLSANLESMGAYSFQSTPLEYIKVPSQVEVLPKGVLKNCKSLASLSLPANLKTVEAEALYGCTALRNLSIEAIDPPTIKDRSAMRGINTDLCIISIPTQSFRKYVLAEYWGQFVQMRNDISVETSGNGEIAFEGVEEDEDEESPNMRPSARGRKRVSELASEDEESMTYASNGSTVYIPQQGQVRFYIIPAEGEVILSATLDGENIMPYIVNGIYTATADKKNAKLVVVFSDGQGSAGLMGDVNGDGDVSVTDVGCVINYILEQVPDPFIPAAADMNSDGSISVTDVGFIINYILNDGAAFCRAEHNATYSYGVPVLMQDTEGYVLTLDGADAFIAFQMDIFVQEDADGYNVRLKDTGTNHQMVCRRLSDGHFRVVCYSPTNETFPDGLTDLLTFVSDGNMTISNIRFTTESLDEVRFDDISATPTSIASVTDLKTTDIKVYTLEGQLYRIVHARQGENPLKDLQPGIYLINDRKYIIR